MPKTFRCKCIIIGESAVGKTSIVKKLLGPPNYSFPIKYLMTTDVDIYTKTFRSPDNEHNIELFVHDCPGKNFYRNVIKNILANNASLIVAVFDVTNEDSYRSLQTLLSEFLKSIKSEDSLIGVIIGNKNDLTESRIISNEDAHQMAKKYKMRYYDCSAKSSSGIDDAFVHLITSWYEVYGANDYNTNHTN